MAVTADSVVVELIAKTDGYTAAVNGAASASAAGMSKIEQSAAKAEAAVQNGADRMGASLKRAANDIDNSSGRIANAQRNLGRQIADIGVGISGGQSPFLILAQQAPQVADALADTGGKAAGVAAFFAGPWGAALLAAGSALAVLIPKLLEAGESTDDLVKKLQDQATKARLAADAQAIFEKSLYGAADASAKLSKQLAEQNRSQLQVAQSALAAATAVRQITLANLRKEASDASTAATAAKAARIAPALGPGGNVQGVVTATADRETAANKRLAIARLALANAEKAVVEASVPLLKIQGAEQADVSAAATGRHTRAVDALTASYRKAQAAAAKLNGAAGNTARAEAVRTFRSGVAGADRQLAAEQEAIRESRKKGPKGPSAETLARRAEAARVKEVRNDEAYQTEREQLNQQIIGARRTQVIEATQMADIDREAVASELKKRLAQIDADQSAKKFDAQQAADLRQRAQDLAATKNQGIDQTLGQRLAEQQLAAAEADFTNQRDILQTSAGLADTNSKRRDAALRLLDLSEQQERLELQSVIASTKATEAQKQIAQKRLDSLAAIYGGQREVINQQTEGAAARYRRDIASVGNDINEAVDAVAVDGMQRLNDQLADAILGANSLGDVFKNVSNQIIGDLLRIAIQQSIIKPLSGLLSGGQGESSGGGIGGFFGSLAGAVGGFLGRGTATSGGITAAQGLARPTFGGGSQGNPEGVLSLFGRASGGYVGAGQTVRVNEARSQGVELLRMGSQGGTIIPLGQVANQPSSRGGNTYHISVSADNSVTPAGFARGLAADILTEAKRMDSRSSKATLRDVPGYTAQRQSLKG